LELGKKDDSGSRSIALTARTPLGSNQALTESYAYYKQVFETDPDTGDAWTKDSVNDAEFGTKIAA
jgi:hypothetical protein